MRLARHDDAPVLAAMMRDPVLDLFPRFYDERQRASAAVHIGRLDMTLIEDGSEIERVELTLPEACAWPASPWSVRSAKPDAGVTFGSRLPDSASGS